MTSRPSIVALDRAHVWHPYSSIDDHEARDPLVIASARGAWLEDANGKKYIDGNSSWWVASLGHGHPRLLRALTEQASRLDHVSLAGTTHEPGTLLAKELCEVVPSTLKHVFYTDNGSSAVEVALRIAAQAWSQLGKPKKRRFVALDGAYHGDTLGAASLGGIDVFTKGFAGLALECLRAPFPEPNAYERAFGAMTDLLRREGDSIAAVVVEPIVQGASGMRIYEPRFLKDLRKACDDAGVFLIIDEVFAGYGRTGKMWAFEHAGIAPDILCIGKTFTSIIPMAATLVTSRIYDAFRGGRDRALHYGHTFCGNPIGAALAREVLAIFRDEKIVAQADEKSRLIARAFDRIAKMNGVLRVRHIGMIGAADLEPSQEGGYLDPIGWRVYDEGLKRGAYLRPLGNTVYVAPPLTISIEDLESLLAIVEASIAAAR
ncbi:MAG: adenosylmethionine--8-amino-7-oxononanoate transaminase [Polyangiaceae bacterium]